MFHFAASLRLEAPLLEGIEMNTKGTLRVLKIAKKMKNLVAFVHLSTAFCYPDYDRLAERVRFLFHCIVCSSFDVIIEHKYIISIMKPHNVNRHLITCIMLEKAEYKHLL